jgi:hypothetical protein
LSRARKAGEREISGWRFMEVDSACGADRLEEQATAAREVFTSSVGSDVILRDRCRGARPVFGTGDTLGTMLEFTILRQL